MPATAEEIEKNTSGTTAVKSRLRNTSPSGLSPSASLPRISPRADPTAMKRSSTRRTRNS